MSKDNVIKLGDFGEAKTQEQAAKTQRHTKVGTELYMSPEMLNHRVREGFKYSLKTDIWGVGMVLAELMCLDYPFEYENEAQRMKIISKVKHECLRKFPEHYPLWV